MARTKEELQQQTAKTRSNIISVSLKLFARYGYEGASMRMIAKEAKISLGLTYNYFKNKEALLLAIFTDGFDAIKAAYTPDAAAAPTDQLKMIIDRNLQLVQEQPDYYKLFFALKLQPEVIGNLSDELQKWEEELIDSLKENFVRMAYAEPVAEARIFMAAIEGIGHQILGSAKAYPADAIAALLLEKYLQKPEMKKEIQETTPAPAENKQDEVKSEMPDESTADPAPKAAKKPKAKPQKEEKPKEPQSQISLF